MAENYEIRTNGKVVPKKDGILANSLKDLFFMTREKVISVTIDRTPEGVKTNVAYRGELVLPDLMDCAAWTERVAKRQFEQSGKDHHEVNAHFVDYHFDPLGFERLARYVVGRLENG